MQARITAKGQITIPEAVREHLHVQAGDTLEFKIEGGQVLVEPIRRRSLLEFRGRFPVGQTLPYEQEHAQARAARAARLGPNNDPTMTHRMPPLPALTLPVDEALS